jgi:hypothetical protein
MRKIRIYLRLTAAVSLLAAILACGSSSDDAVPSAEAPPEEQARSGALRELEAHLTEGSTYGDGPDGVELARIVRDTLAPGDGVAVRIIPGVPRNVVVLVRYRSTHGYEDLREISVRERNAEIDRIVAAIDDGYGAETDNLAVAIRGALFYGAVGVRRAGTAMEYHTGSVVSLSTIDPILGATPGADAPVPALAVGTQLEGTIVGPGGTPPSYRIELTEETVFVTQLATVATDDGPFLTLCRGAKRPWICADDESLVPIDDFQNDGLDDLAAELLQSGRMLDYQAYRLAPGIYTAVVVPNCDPGAPCPAEGTPYTLFATAPPRRD